MANELAWEVKLRSGEAFSDAKADSIEFNLNVANFRVMASPEKIEKKKWLCFSWEEKTEAVYQVVLSIPLDNIAFIRLKVQQKEEANGKS
jgi:hypothetical protein